jgi:hypothetical protein
VLVGAGAEQRRFTVDHELITKRSRFFRTARRTTGKSKPVDLQDRDPEIFAHYLHCVYRDAVPYYNMFVDDEDDEEYDEEHDATYAMELICSDKYWADKYYEYLVKLYTTADGLQDPITANMVIDEVRRISRKASTPQSDALEYAFEHTLPGDNMRKVLADIFIFSGDVFDDDIDYPADFLKLVLERFKTMRETNTEVGDATTKVGEKTLWAFGGSEGGHQACRKYHQETEEDTKMEEGEASEEGGAEVEE